MDSVGEGKGGKIWENGIETCKISCMKRDASPGSMHDTGALEPGAGDVTLSFALAGDSLRARWAVRAGAVRWTRDSAAGPGSTLDQLVTRVLQGITQLDLSAE